MSKPILLLAMGATALLVHACAEQRTEAGTWVEANLPQEEYQAAKNAEPTGTDFNRQLYQGYMEVATRERAEFDWSDSQLFSKKALAAAENDWVAPEALFDWKIPDDSVAEFKAAQRNLNSLLESGARTQAPTEAARAQVNFDCWIQEQEENHQPADIAACRSAFYEALGRVQTAMTPSGEQYVVYFDTDSANLAAQQIETVMAAAFIAKGADFKVLVSGYTDNTGSETRNMALSKERAAAVEGLLLSAGVKSKQIETAHYGATHPAVESNPGTPESKNRRVEINLLD